MVKLEALQTVDITAVGAQGDGLAAAGLFVPLTLPGERVAVLVEGQRGEVQDIVSASADRVPAPCRHFGDCGGCALQHWAPGPYLAWKAEQVRLALGRERIETEILAPFAAAPGTRRRLALHARKVRGGAAIGFKARRSWRLAEISECPISDPRLVAAFPALAKLAAPFLEHPKSAPTLHVTWTATGLDVDVTGVERRSGGLSADARLRAAEAAQAGDMARVTLAGEMVFMARQPVVRLGPATVALPAGAFLQAVPQAEAAMADFAIAGLDGASKLADLFCGVGTFTFRLAAKASVRACDSSEPAIKALGSAVATAPGLKPIQAETRDLTRRPMLSGELNKLDGAVLDPPRAGALEQVGEIARSKLSRVAYASCNPTTFARDARVLADAGFKLERVLPVDQFLWSPHVELVGIFGR
jgi:23S rRNA (uracil1939-C5)-methyltransferase